MSTKTINGHDSASGGIAGYNWNVLVENKDLTGSNEVHRKMLAGNLMAGIITDYYNTATTYNIGDTCIYEAKLYYCSATTTGDFDSTKWTQITAMGNFEVQNNKVTSISSSSTDAQYPSAKLVYDQLLLKEVLANKVTEVSSSSTDTQYPSAKCIYDNCAGNSTDSEIISAFNNCFNAN